MPSRLKSSMTHLGFKPASAAEYEVPVTIRNGLAAGCAEEAMLGLTGAIIEDEFDPSPPQAARAKRLAIASGVGFKVSI